MENDESESPSIMSQSSHNEEKPQWYKEIMDKPYMKVMFNKYNVNTMINHNYTDTS